VGSAYDVSLTGRAPVGGGGCRQRGAHATAVVWAEVFVGPDTTVSRVEGCRLLRVLSEYLAKGWPYMPDSRHQ
jgi:hypothetical protein